METVPVCTAAKKCGGCQYQGLTYPEQLLKKRRQTEKLLKKYGAVSPMIPMEDPFYYRNKVHRAFGTDRKGRAAFGTYKEHTHTIIPVEECLIEDRKSQEIIATVFGLLKSFKIKTYDEDTGYGLLRHVLVRRGFQTGEIMVVLVLGSPILPSKNRFVEALRKVHPEITTVVLNINDKKTSMILGEREKPIYGPGFIRDRLCGLTFRISPGSFYQVNPVQTEILYGKALEFAALTGKEKVIDAYCGIGTISLSLAKSAGSVTGVELSPQAVADARINARENKITNVKFIQADAGNFMENLSARGEKADVVVLDPPRTGCDGKFLQSLIRLSPERVVYISCNPLTLDRDLKILTGKGYRAARIQPVDMFPWTDETEVCCQLVRRS